VLKRFIKNERRAVCIALWLISFSVSCIDFKFSTQGYDSLQKFWWEKITGKSAEKTSWKIFEGNECKNFLFQIKRGGRNVGGEVLCY
jgi:hypothetical protein